MRLARRGVDIRRIDLEEADELPAILKGEGVVVLRRRGEARYARDEPRGRRAVIEALLRRTDCRGRVVPYQSGDQVEDPGSVGQVSRTDAARELPRSDSIRVGGWETIRCEASLVFLMSMTGCSV